jgi:peptidoglycan/xylan/chitin deacetylase (PgdA/CDA1 family)/glycosyltransferase involved in cell wall biosynthesis
MNILHLLSQNQLTGAEVYACQLIEKQVQKNHKVIQVSNDFFYETKAQKICLPVENKSFLQFIKSVLTLRKILVTENIQIIHAHSRAASKLAFWARCGLKIGYLSTIHGRQHVSLSKKIHNIYGDFLVPVCENISVQLTQEFKYNVRRIKTVSNGIDPVKFQFKSRPVMDSKLIRIGIIGRDTGPKKLRTEIFIENLIPILKDQGYQYQFTIIGGSKKNFKINVENVNYLNPKQLNSKFYQDFDLICGSGRVCIEALLSGLPCIAFGESIYCGLVTVENYADFKKSNFGDIGHDFNLPQFNKKQAEMDVQQFTKIDTKSLADITAQDFDLDLISNQIERLYESSYFIRHWPKWIPILMYHKIPDQDLQSQHKIFVNKTNFKKHLQFFTSLGFQTLTFSELAEFRKAKKDFNHFPKKPLILTFDDGYVDNIINADPLLKEFGMTAQIFLLADSKVDSNRWDYDTNNSSQEFSPIMPADQRTLWKKSNFQIGSHGIKHDRLPKMSWSEKKLELTESKKILESEFQTQINVFAYTYGDTNAECAKACEASGYDYGLNTDRGGLHLEEAPYSVFRVNIFPNESWLSLWKKTAPWYRRYYYFKRKV